MNSNIKTDFAASIAANVVVVATATLGTEKAKAELAKNLAGAFASVPTGNMKAFSVLFGNGDAPKSKTYLPGSIAVAVRAAIAKVAKDKQTMALNILKTRLSECRRAFRESLVLAADETVQAALKRVIKKAADPKPADGAPAEGSDGSFVIPANASMDSIAEALSVWVATHGSAAAGLSKKLADFLPISTKRTVKAA